MARRTSKKTPKSVETLVHDEATRLNIPTAEHQPVMAEEDRAPVEVRYPRGVSGLEEEKARRDRDLDPQIVWRGKDDKDWSELVVHAPPLYIQEKIHPKALIDDLMRQSRKNEPQEAEQIDLFADFNGLPEDADKTDFYQTAPQCSAYSCEAA